MELIKKYKQGKLTTSDIAHINRTSYIKYFNNLNMLIVCRIILRAALGS